MKSALIHLILLIFEICVFVDAETVSVTKGESVTLHTGVTEILRDDEIEWRLNGNLIAEISGGSIRTEGPSGDRLQLDRQTGDLKITNIETTDSGEYKLEITRTRVSSKIFIVSVGSGGDEVKSVSLIEGDSVTLNSGTNIERDDVIEWRFGDLNTLIAENNRKTGTFSTSDVPDGRFRERLQLDYTTGSLTIRKIEIKHSGFYEAGIRKSSSGHTIYKSYSVTASGEIKSAQSVKKGESVTLHTGLTDIQTDDLMQWMFEDTVLAEFKIADKRFLTSDGPDERFRDRLKLDHQTGSLTIMNIRFTDSGLYELKTFISRFIIYKMCPVTVTGEIKSVLSVMKGESVTLNSDLTDIQTDDLVWMFRDSQIVEIKAHRRLPTSDGLDVRFRDRMKLDHQTGSLTITHTTTEDSGEYTLKISNSRRTILKTITVSVYDPALSTGAIVGIGVGVLLVFAAAVAGILHHRWISKLIEWAYEMTMPSVMVGEPITLNPDDVHKDDRLQWMFRSCCIAERKSGADSFTEHDLPDGRFNGRLKLDPRTGSLSIPITKTIDTGDFELLIIRPGKSSIKRFRVSVFAQTDDIKTVSVKKGGSVTLETGVADIRKVEQIQWKCGLNLRLAEITRGIKKISPSAAKILEVKLDLDRKTGSLTIKKIKPTDAGIYMLRKIEEGGNITTKLFRVSVSESTDNRNNPEEMHLNSVP